MNIKYIHDELIVIDNFLDDDFVQHIQDVIPDLTYKGHGSVDTKNYFNSAGQWPQTDAFNFVGKKLLSLDCVKIENILRCYVNLHPSGPNHGGHFHTDDGDITAIYYSHDWDTKYGGGTDFEDGTEIDYKKNRLILFNAHTPHRGMEHSHPNLFRYTVAFKLVAKWNQ
jgi:hypothetical protein